jgi:hypothetical protein
VVLAEAAHVTELDLGVFSDSSARTTLLVRKFIACSPAHCAERRVPPPYQSRS